MRASRPRLPLRRPRRPKLLRSFLTRAHSARSGARPARLAGAVVGAVLAATGCGYTFVVAPSVAQVTAGRPVRVPPFENHSLEADAAIIASQSAARQLGVRGVRLSDGAPLVLAGVVESVTAVPIASTDAQAIALWRVDARVTMELREAGQTKVLAKAVVSDAQTFLPAADVEATEVSRRLAVHHLLERLASAGIDQLHTPQ